MTAPAPPHTPGQTMTAPPSPQIPGQTMTTCPPPNTLGQTMITPSPAPHNGSGQSDALGDGRSLEFLLLPKIPSSINPSVHPFNKHQAQQRQKDAQWDLLGSLWTQL